MKNEKEIAKNISEKIDCMFNKNKENLKNEVLDILYKNINLMEKEPAVIPNDKVVISAKLFSELVNIASYAEKQELIREGFLQELIKDVSMNRETLTKPKQCNCKKSHGDSTTQKKESCTDDKEESQNPFAGLSGEDIDMLTEFLKKAFSQVQEEKTNGFYDARPKHNVPLFWCGK